MGNSNTTESNGYRPDQSLSESDNEIPDFDARWKRFIESLDLSPEHVKQIELLHTHKKKELLLSYEAKNPQYSSFQFVVFLKSFRIDHLLKKKTEGQVLRTLLSSLDISLRSTSVEWMYEFLDSDGLEVIAEFMFQCLHFLSSQNDPAPSKKSGVSLKSNKNWCGPRYDLYCTTENFDYLFSKDKAGNVPCNLLENCSVFNYLPHLNGPMKSCSSITLGICDLLRDCIHLSLRCFRTILNNQKGCKRALDHPHMISLLAFCLLHPSYMTKALTLDILTALCLIEGGHVKVLQAFDRLRVVMGEGLRFELLLTAFRHHEILDEKQYNLEFSVTCVQFLNIVVHSPENINLRVYLQYEMHLLGLDDFLKKIRERANPRLCVQINAYLDNRVDCSLLLEDAKAKETAIMEQTRLRRELYNEINAKREMEVCYKAKQTELTALIESSNKHLQQQDVNGTDKQLELQKQIGELQVLLNETQKENMKLRESLVFIKTNNKQESSIKAEKSVLRSTNLDINTTITTTTTTTGGSNSGKIRHCLTDREAGGSLDTHTFNLHSSNQIRLSPSGSEASISNDQPNQIVNDNTGIGSANRKEEKQQRKCLNQKQFGWTAQNLDSSRTLAAQATSLLTALVNAVTKAIEEVSRQNPNAFTTMIHPIGWTFTYPTGSGSSSKTNSNSTQSVQQAKQQQQQPHSTNSATVNNENNSNVIVSIGSSSNMNEETVFNANIFHKCLILNELNKSDMVTLTETGMFTLENFFDTHSKQFHQEPWLTVMNKCKAYFESNVDAGQHVKLLSTVDWLQQIGLLQNHHQSLNDCLNQLNESKLFYQLINLQLNPFCTQYLLYECQQRCVCTTTVDDHSVDSSTRLLFVRLEQLLERSLSLSATNFHYTYGKYEQPIVISFLQANLMKHTLLIELQFLIENLSTLLEGCSSILVNHKLPLILQLVWYFTASVLGDFKSTGYSLKSLDSLLNWHLPISAHSITNPTGRGDIKSENNVNCKFMPTFVKFIADTAPSLINWSTELNHAENAAKISLLDIQIRLERMQMGLKIWRYCAENLNSKLLLPVDESNHLLELLTKTISTVSMTVHSTAVWLQALVHTNAHMQSDNHVLQSDWLSPLIRFGAAFKVSADDLNFKHNKCGSLDANLHSATNSNEHPYQHRHRHHNHRRHRHRQSEEEKSQRGTTERQAKTKNEVPSEHKRSRIRRRTRRLDADGVMDDILHDLTLNPLRADIHTKCNE